MTKVKMKTCKGAAKRFKLTGSGKLVRRKRNKNHLLTKKTTKRKRRLNSKAVVTPGDAARADVQLPYKKYLR